MAFIRTVLARLLVSLILAACVVVAARAQHVSAKGQAAVSTEHMATTAHPLATEAAMSILRKGGNAVDGAVAAAFAIGVVEPDGSGIGGGGGMVIYLRKKNSAIYINYYHQASGEIATLAYDPRKDNATAKGVLVPGTVAGLVAALERYGTLPLATVMEPAIRYAEEGFPVDETLAKIILDNVSLLQRYPATTSIYMRDGFPLAQDDTLRNPELAATLREIAARGARGFYEGPVAGKIVEDVVREGGVLTLEDMRNYKARITKALHGTYRGREIFTAEAPQSGSTVIQALNILENVNLSALGHFALSAESLHLMAEALKRSYADRMAFLDDPRFAHVPQTGLTSKLYARTRFEDIDMAEAVPREYRKTKAGNPMSFDTPAADRMQRKVVPENRFQTDWDDEDEEGSTSTARPDELFNRWGGKRSPVVKQKDTTAAPKGEEIEIDPDRREIEGGEGGHTTHLCVADRDGNMVSLTQTLGTFFGSGLTSAGVLLNTGMANFSATAVNAAGPNRQPRSSIAPTILLKDGEPYLAVGSPGAARIIATVVELIVNLVDFGMKADEANNAPRFLCQKFDDYLSLESRIAPDVQEGLKKKGHTLRVFGDFDLFFGGAQLILFDAATHTYYGSADPRRGGVAIGD